GTNEKNLVGGFDAGGRPACKCAPSVYAILRRFEIGKSDRCRCGNPHHQSPCRAYRGCVGSRRTKGSMGLRGTSTEYFLEDRRGPQDEAPTGYANYHLGMAGKGSLSPCFQRT